MGEWDRPRLGGAPIAQLDARAQPCASAQVAESRALPIRVPGPLECRRGLTVGRAEAERGLLTDLCAGAPDA